MVSVDWPFFLVAALLTLGGLVAAAWAIFADRSRGRRRCPRCWYDMSRTEGRRCPECGREARREKRLFRTRRRWKVVFAAGLVLMLALLLGVHAKVRRALGATRKHIVAQFLVETGTLSSVGGLIGIAVGVGASVGSASFLPWILNLGIVRRFFETNFKLETQVTLWSIIVSFVVAAVVGIAFGIYPAVVASRKDPVVALRHD